MPGAITYLRQAPAAIVVGVLCGLTLIGLSAVAEWLQGVIWEDLSSALGVDPDAGWWIVAVLTATGLGVGLVVRFAPGHAGPDPATAELVSRPIPAAALPGLALALVLVLAGGVSLGPENPIMLLNASLIVLLGIRLLPHSSVPAWVQLSVAGTLGAMFGTPLAAALMLTETQPGDPRIPIWDRMVGPLLAAGSGTAVMLSLSDLSLSLDVPGYTGFQVGDLATASVIALAACALGILAAYALSPLHAAFHRISNPVLMLTAGGLVLGLLGAVGGRETLFKGLDEMKDISSSIGDYSPADLALFVAVKLLALLVAAAASFRGGRIFPAMFVGVMAGWLVHGLIDAIPAAVAVTAATLGILIAATRNGWLAIFMALVVVPDAELLPILVLAALPAWLLVLGRPELRAEAPAPDSQAA